MYALIQRTYAVARRRDFSLPFDQLRIDGSIALFGYVVFVFALAEGKNEND